MEVFKSVELLKQYLSETPKEQLLKEVDEAFALGFTGLCIINFLDNPETTKIGFK